MDHNARIRELALTIPEPAKPLASYVPVQVVQNLAFVSGQLPLRDGKLIAAGRVGETVSMEEALDCARQCALNILGALRAAIGDLNNVERLVKLSVFVAAPGSFADHPKVANGASDLFVEIFGDAGKHARAAVGVASLPLSAPVEIEAIFEIR